MTAEMMMKEYSNMKRELSILEFQIRQFKGASEDDIILSMQFSHQEGDRVQTSTLSDKTASVAINYKKVLERENDEWFEFLWNRYHIIREEILFFEESIKCLPGVLPGMITKMIQGGITWDELALEYHVSRRTVANYRKQAIKELNTMYEIRESCAADYMLS